MERLQIGGCLPCCLCGSWCRCCNRQKIRTVYNIQEDPNDAIATFCCGFCAFFQEMQEIKIQEGLKYGFLGALTTEDGGELGPAKGTFTGFTR
jgi:fluoride ion exporter CrcB/FEX